MAVQRFQEVVAVAATEKYTIRAKVADLLVEAEARPEGVDTWQQED
jgi:CO/xanthine dehydrogenase Mo-binding subunit